uniref:Uncharacterized protein LOC105137534 n=1 Tax=Rhizophora mucronata TaxID=61149 RepID=A0A2P2JIN1_RHIMU
MVFVLLNKTYVAQAKSSLLASDMF